MPWWGMLLIILGSLGLGGFAVFMWIMIRFAKEMDRTFGY